MRKLLRKIKYKCFLNKHFLNKKVDYKRINPLIILKKTNMFYTYAYSDLLDCTFKINKEQDIIEKIWLGRRWQVI